MAGRRSAPAAQPPVVSQIEGKRQRAFAMGERPHAVALVVDPEFGERPLDLSRRIHVWALDTPTNRTVAERVWREAGGTHSLENGITTFKGSPDAASDEIVGHQLPTIDLHHGAHSHSPPWNVLEVYGAPPTTGLRAVLSEYGLTEVRATAHGFVATAPSVVSAG